MRTLLRLLVKYHFTLLFLFFETVALIILFNNNDFQKSRFFNKVNEISGFLYHRTAIVQDYFYLRKQNEALALENNKLRNVLSGLNYQILDHNLPSNLVKRNYEFIQGRVINNSVNKQNNYITLDIGSSSGVKPDMGVVSDAGIIGIVKTVSKNYCTLISLLNQNLRVSAKLKESNYFGSLIWEGGDYTEALLLEVPGHVEVQLGDTVVSSGYSMSFPPMETIGVVKDFKKVDGESFMKIYVALSVDFKNLDRVYIVNNLNRNELIKLQEQEDD